MGFWVQPMQQCVLFGQCLSRQVVPPATAGCRAVIAPTVIETTARTSVEIEISRFFMVSSVVPPIVPPHLTPGARRSRRGETYGPSAASKGPMAPTSCPLCGGRATGEELGESRWLAPDVIARLSAEHPEWRREDGACVSCRQEALLQVLLHHGHNAFHAGVQSVWPLDVEAAFGAIPTPLRMHADPRFTGRGVTASSGSS